MTPSERRKFLAEVKAKKAAAGYISSDPAGVLHRKNKRKDTVSRDDLAVFQVDVEVEQHDCAAVEVVGSPKNKRSKVDKRLAVGEKGTSSAATSSLNEKVAESFWHKDFDFRK